jgi:phosphoglycolate phosphatase
MHDLLLFDLDGTLSDPIVGIGRSINHALTHFGYDPLEPSSVAAFVGPQIDAIFVSITGSNEPKHIGELVTKYRERYSEVGFSENELYPGISEVLMKLSEANVPLGVCTSKRKDFAERILEMFELRDHFLFVSGGDVGIHKWQQIKDLKNAGAVSASSIMIGDRAVDITSAKRNGLSSAGVLWGHGTRSELEAEAPSYLLSSPEELPFLVRANPSIERARPG